MNPKILDRNRWYRRGVLPAAIALALGGLPVSAGSAPAPSGDVPAASTWLAVAASGTVRAGTALEKEAVWRDVSRGDELQSETHLKTGRKGRATLSRSASLLMVAPESEVELPGEGRGDMETSVIQTAGSVLYEVDGRANPHFEVVTPYLVAGVKGTTFLVTVNDQYTSVTVRKGLVEISDPDTDETFHLRPGESAIRHRTEAKMELVYDRSRSKEARKEAKKIDRMQRDEKVHDGATDFAAIDPVEENNQPKPFTSNPFGSPTDSKNGDSDKMAQELLEEMIGEEIQDGDLKPGSGPGLGNAADDGTGKNPGLEVELPPRGGN